MKRSLLLIPAILLFGCGRRVEQYVLPGQVSDFTTLYDNNCAGCHGAGGRMGAARPLNDPLYLAVIGNQTLKDVIANGVPKTAMPAFSQSAGGVLTDRQITILANQIEERWSRPQEVTTADLPPYRGNLGDAKAGEAVFRENCASCHGEGGVGSSKAGSVVDRAYLALVSDQSLRSTVIAGRIGQGTPDRRACSPAHPITPKEISDVVAWLSMHREAPFNLTQRGTNLP